MKGFISAFSFLTIAGRGATPGPQTMIWFPVVGAGIGAALGAIAELSGRWWSPGVVAALVVIADLAITGALHADGLVDTADGLLPHASRERRLEIMATPDVGAFGAASLVGLLLLRAGAIASAEVRVLAFVAIWTASRSVIVGAAALMAYARNSGLASAMLGAPKSALLTAGGLGLFAAATLAWADLGGQGIAAVAAVAVGAAGVASVAQRRLGGFTGDVLGAMVLAGETVGLVVLAGTF